LGWQILRSEDRDWVNRVTLKLLALPPPLGMGSNMKVCHAERSEASRQCDAFLKSVLTMFCSPKGAV
jgi:hypothetical protein